MSNVMVGDWVKIAEDRSSVSHYDSWFEVRKYAGFVGRIKSCHPDHNGWYAINYFSHWVHKSWMTKVWVPNTGDKVQFKGSLNTKTYDDTGNAYPTWDLPQFVRGLILKDLRMTVGDLNMPSCVVSVNTGDKSHSFWVRADWLEPATECSSGSNSKEKESRVSTKLLQKFKDSFMRTVPSVVWDLQSGGVGVQAKDGEIITFETIPAKEGQVAQYKLSVNPISQFALPIPAWALRSQIDQLQPGDVIVLDDNKIAFFLSLVAAAGVANKVIKVIDIESKAESTVNLAINKLFGEQGVLAVKNVFSQAGGNIANALPMLAMFQEDEGELSKNIGMLLMASAFQGNGGDNNNPMAAMLPMMMLGEGGGKLDENSKMFMMMAMMNNGGGGGGNNPMAAMLPMMMLLNKKEAAPAKK